MNAPSQISADREARLVQVLDAYLAAVQEGNPPSREELLAQHPELADDLRECLASLEFIRGMEMRPEQSSSGGLISPKGEMGALGDFRIVREVGRGGMGIVYEAEQISLHRRVALKVLPFAATMDPRHLQRFHNEAQAAAQLDHPHIVPVYEVGVRTGHFFFSMKLIEGGGLDAQLARFRDNPREVARLVAQVARAVHHAHQHGILHRDLKPSNILLDREGQPHVSDFGLAKRIEADGNLTQTGAIVGTPQYMAPEQTRGQKGAVTTATDVYGLGTVLYALLMGQPPFRGETVLETLEQVREREPEPLRWINAKVDRDLETICLKCLHKEPQRRYESAQALADDLERWMSGELIHARRVGRGERLRKWVRRRPALAGLVGVSILSVLGLLVGLLWHDARLQESAEREHQAAERER